MRLLVVGDDLAEPAGPDESPVRLVIRLDGENDVRYPLFRTENESETGNYTVYEGTVTLRDRGLYWYSFEIETTAGLLKVSRSGPDNKAVTSRADECPEPVSCWQQTVYKQDYRDPDWIYGGIYYHVFVDRFCHVGDQVYLPGKTTRDDWGGMPEYLPVNGRILNNDFFGGNLRGIREKLPYFESLGVTCLYLSPIVEAYSSHKYDTADYTKVDPMFGTMEDFEALCSDAAKRGIRVICDGVFSHTGSDSIYFNKEKHYGEGGAYNDPDSPYRSWYTFHEDGSYETWWGIDTLPRINKMEPSYREFINGTPDGGTGKPARKGGIAQFWLDHGASGWRLDVVDEFPGEFLTEFVASAKSAKPDALVVGEVWEDASIKEAYGERKNYFRGDRLDSVMNYPLKDAIIRYVRYGDARVLKEAVEDQWEHYPRYIVHALMNILGTHDSVRILTALGGRELEPEAPRELQASTKMTPKERANGLRLLKIAALLQMTLPGVPCIYYGDEAEMEGYKDPFNRKCFPWGNENQDLLAWYRKLTAIRRAHKVYERGEYRTIACSEGMFAFSRYMVRETEAGGTGRSAGAEARKQGPATRKTLAQPIGPNGYVPGTVLNAVIGAVREAVYGPSSMEIITAVNCGNTIRELGLVGTYTDLLTGNEKNGNVTVAPGQVLLLERKQ